jgi:serine/threonine protein kinase/Tfp pilus assembly protein PilF
MNDGPKQDVAIFSKALELPEGQRAGYLAQACGDDEALRLRVEALLRAQTMAGGFMENSPVSRDTAGEFVAGESVGDRIDRYKLLQRIGEGGCGVVFMAEQEEPVHRMVALKVIKPGMDTKSVIARFEAERQALAMMEHPNIAQVLDAGSTGNGRPYFVMELVRGLKITDYCDRHSLNTAARLALFVQVCHAVQHAHRKGIIHRDIKPSNILVTATAEGEPLPKVIDFGIAKATTGQRLTDKTLFTAFEMLIGTPAYMSPEQASLSSLEVDKRTDIYSLGVLLYELLTGTTPFDTRELLQAGLDEIRRVIRDEEPVRPSTRLSAMVEGELKSVSQNRQSEPPKLIREVRGDLDWIVMKALEKDRARRYATANGLAEDIQHYLANEGVSARPPSAFYKLRKLVARNKVLFAAIGAILISLLAGLSIALWSLTKERRARQDAETDKHRAEAAAVKSQQVTRFLQEMLGGATPGMAHGRDTTLLREIVDQTAKRVGAELADQPDVEADLRLTIGTVYDQLGAYDQAEGMFRAVLAFHRKSMPADSGPMVNITSRLGSALLNQGKIDEAEKLMMDLAAHLEQAGKMESLDATPCLENLALVRWKQKRLVEAESRLRKVIAIRTQNLGAGRRETIATLNLLGSVLLTEDKFAEAEQTFREQLEGAQRLFGTDHLQVALIFHNLAWTLAKEHKMEEALTYMKKAVELQRKLLGESDRDAIVSLFSLGEIHQQMGHFAEAENAYRLTLARDHSVLANPESLRVQAVGSLLKILSSQRKQKEFEAVLNEFLTPDVVQQRESAPFLSIRADILARRGQWKEAAEDAAKVVQFVPADHQSYHLLAPLIVAMGNREEYRKLCPGILARFARSQNIYEADRMAKDCSILPSSGADPQAIAELARVAITGGKDPSVLPYFQVSSAMAEYRAGHFATAVEWARKGAAASHRYARVEAGAVLAMAQFQLKQSGEARAALAQCAEAAHDLPTLESGDLGGDWRDWIISHVLLEEARALIPGEPPQNLNRAK